MREIIYKYNRLGSYTTWDDTCFGDQKQLKIVAQPHDFSLEIGDEKLRNTSFAGCTAIVSCDGAVCFYDSDESELAKVDKTQECYKQVVFKWEQGVVTIEFGSTVEVDYYPNCDGEHDRYGTEWAPKRIVKLNLDSNKVEIK